MREVKAIKINVADFAPYGTFCNMTEPEGYPLQGEIHKFYPDRISGNIELAKRIIGDTNRLRPHVKTNKAAEVSRMLLDAGVPGFAGAWLRHRGLDWAADLLPSFPGLAPGSLADQPLENLP